MPHTWNSLLNKHKAKSFAAEVGIVGYINASTMAFDALGSSSSAAGGLPAVLTTAWKQLKYIFVVQQLLVILEANLTVSKPNMSHIRD